MHRYGGSAVEAWLDGQPVDWADPLSDQELEELDRTWEFWARPGQVWTPGPEATTVWSCGRGFGKTTIVAHALCRMAETPEVVGYHAAVVSITPSDVRRLFIDGDSGILTTARSFRYPVPEARLSPPMHVQFASPDGERKGLTVHMHSAANPSAARGDNIGMLIADEFGFFPDVRDAAGATSWQALEKALRVGIAKSIIVTSPSRKPELLELRRLAEQPTCAACGHVQSPSPRTRYHETLSVTTTEVERRCEKCGADVTATVRLIRATSLDNRALTESRRRLWAAELSAGSLGARREIGGEIEDDGGGKPIPWIEIRKVSGTDRSSVLRELRIDRAIVVVDPATTSGDDACITGAMVIGGRQGTEGLREAVALEDLSVLPEEVTTSPSAIWAPRAAIAVCRWGASEVHIENNQGGDEVIVPVRDQLMQIASGKGKAFDLLAELETCLLGQHDARARLGRMRAQARRVAGKVFAITRRAGKLERWDWASIPAASRRIWLAESAVFSAWSATAEHVTGFTGHARREPIDRGDTLISGAQVLLGVEERAGRVVDPLRSPLFSAAAGRLGR
jgi:phage terminase large subunit-like protein